MRIVPALVLALFLCTPAMQAQDTPAAEIFGGYSYLSFDGGSLGSSERIGLNGFGTSVTGNINRVIGIEGEIGSHWGSDCGGSGLDCNQLSFMAGPRFAFRGSSVTGFVHNLYGVSHASVGLSGVNVTDNSFALAIGGGVDVKASNVVSIRVAQFDYVMTDLYSGLGADRQNNFRFQAGVVLTFGRH